MAANTFKILLLCLFSNFLFAQEELPFVENFTKSDYNGDNQNWNVAQGNDNAMYFANNHYFLRYNGVKWEKYTLPNKTIIRSIFIDGDRIYCGSYKEFGYWKRLDGKMRYYSLSRDKNLFKGTSDNEEIWKVFKYKNNIYFQSFNELYIYNEQQTEKISFPSQISYCYLVNGEIYAASVRNGVYVMKGNTFVKKDSWKGLEFNVIHNIESNQGKIYVFTKNNGVFVEENGNLILWKHPLNDILKSQVIVTAKFVDDHTLAIGSGLQGLYICNLKDNSVKNINRQNALKNNAILSIGIDRENDLWLGLDNGICHVEINSPISVFSDNSGLLGSVYSLSTIPGGYLFVTNHGVFTCKDQKLQVIPNSKGQVWDIYKNGNQFIIGHNDGTFTYDGTALKKVNTVNGGWKFLNSDFDNAYFQGNYSGIAVYSDRNDLTKARFLSGLTKPIRNIAQNKPGEIWAADNYRSLYRILYDKNFNTKKIENISALNGIANDYGVKIFSYKNEILFLIDNSWYSYNSITDKLEKDPIFEKVFNKISDIIPIDDNSFMVVKSGLLYLIQQEGNHFLWHLIPQKYYDGKLIIENTKVYKAGNSLLINLDDGFMGFQLNKTKKQQQEINIEGFYQGKLITSDTKIKYNQSVDINLIPNFYGYNRPELFYKLNASENYIRVKSGHLSLNNLESGTQNLAVYYNNGRSLINIGTYEFHVGNPWYFSIWMILVYVLAIAGSFFLYYKWNQVRYSEKLKLHEEELKHQKKILEIELKAENELNVQEYEKHILELEIQTKSSEVAGKSLSIAKQSEMIDNIQTILDSEQDIDKLKNEVKKAIRVNAVNKHEWETFESNLNQINNEFITKLSKMYPVLTQKDIKLCVYLRMNMSSKEIAPLMNISFRGVELHRYRLRKKLNLTQEESLSKFMLTL
ncbi:hypothetical protein FNO01nite_14810 [Flavobacterium noncentrifugens]|uniref:helix-turn-helix and ligand-binding sensor domain-containing protein n=1 Tax=Flavobacterium noncentrifugens TaxID=1128970 RepID=UPI000B831533|nr:histidine kinase [Flavobacterium noncentrifugens]GEP50809.1 hypothetical protein FNO01nite_14810 [Flavobacterium noncentrifugens]